MYSNNTKSKLCTYTMLLNFLEISDAFFVSHAKSLYKIFSRGEVFMWPNVRSTHVLLTEVSNSYEKTSQFVPSWQFVSRILTAWRSKVQKSLNLKNNFSKQYCFRVIAESIQNSLNLMEIVQKSIDIENFF